MTVNLNFPPVIKIVVEYADKPELKEISMKLDEVIAQVSAVSGQLARASVEIQDRIQKLQDSLGELTPEQVAAIDQLKAAAAAIDDIAPPIEPPVEPEPEPQPEGMKGSPVGLGSKTSGTKEEPSGDHSIKHAKK
jgi:hypothetical protein